MDYREYGRTGKKVSAIGFGGLRFPKEDYQSGNYENSVKIIHRAHELGVNYFDTAPDYCDEHRGYFWTSISNNGPQYILCFY